MALSIEILNFDKINISERYHPRIDASKVYNLIFPSRVMKEMTEKPIPKRTIPKKVMAMGVRLCRLMLPISFSPAFCILSSHSEIKINRRKRSKSVLAKFVIIAKTTPYNKAEMVDIKTCRGEKTTI